MPLNGAGVDGTAVSSRPIKSDFGLTGTPANVQKAIKMRDVASGMTIVYSKSPPSNAKIASQIVPRTNGSGLPCIRDSSRPRNMQNGTHELPLAARLAAAENLTDTRLNETFYRVQISSSNPSSVASGDVKFKQRFKSESINQTPNRIRKLKLPTYNEEYSTADQGSS